VSTPAPTLDVERELAARRGPGRRLVVGIDEVGRGALAGPVAVGACAIELMDGIAVPLPEGVRDSKKLTPRRRSALVDPILSAAHAGAVGWATAAEIDELGIMPALASAALRALDALDLTSEIDAIVLDGDVDVLTAGLMTAERPAPLVHLQVAADRDCVSVAAASILAKVARDEHMVALDAAAPEYRWASNKGYGSAVHREAIDRLGAHEHHRRSWRLGSRPVTSRVPAPEPVPVTEPVTVSAPVPALVPTVAGRVGFPAEPSEAGRLSGTGDAGVLWDDQWYPQDGKERR